MQRKKKVVIKLPSLERFPVMLLYEIFIIHCQKTTVDAQIQKASRLPRTEALNPHTHRQPTRRIPLVVTYHPGLTILSRIARKHHPIFHTSNRLKKAIPDPPTVAFRRPKNMRLTRSSKTETTSPSHECHKHKVQQQPRGCKCCHEIATCNKFKSKATGRQNNIRAEITCKSRNLVYLISCKKCGLQFVGEIENTWMNATAPTSEQERLRSLLQCISTSRTTLHLQISFIQQSIASLFLSLA